jgi:hypothetical protein
MKQEPQGKLSIPLKEQEVYVPVGIKSRNMVQRFDTMLGDWFDKSFVESRTGYFHSKEELRELLQDLYNRGKKYGFVERSIIAGNDNITLPPDFESFINQILEP